MNHKNQNNRTATGPYLIAVCSWCEQKGVSKVRIIDSSRKLEDQISEKDWAEVQNLLNPIQQEMCRAVMSTKHETPYVALTHGICKTCFNTEINGEPRYRARQRNYKHGAENF